MKINSILAGVAALALISCGNKDKPQVTALMKQDTLSEIKSVSDTNKASKPTALTYEELAAYLPSHKGFTAKRKATGESAHAGKSGNAYYSYARQEYIHQNKECYLEIVDYKDAPDILAGLMQMHGIDTLIDNNEFSTNKVDMGKEKIKAVSAVYKNEKSARLTVSVNDRFIVTSGVSGSTDIAILKKLTGAVLLKELPDR